MFAGFCKKGDFAAPRARSQDTLPVPTPFRLVVINLKHTQGRVQLRIVGRVCRAGSVPHPAAQCSATEPQRRCLSVPRQPAGSTRAATASSDSMRRLAHSKSVPAADAHLFAVARDMRDHHERTRPGYSAPFFLCVPSTTHNSGHPATVSRKRVSGSDPAKLRFRYSRM